MGKRPEEEFTMGAFKRHPDDEAVTMPKRVRQPPAAWVRFDGGNVGRGNPLRNARSLAYARAIVAKIDATPALARKGLANLARLRTQRGGTLNGCDEEWEKLLQRLEWSAVRALATPRTTKPQPQPQPRAGAGTLLLESGILSTKMFWMSGECGVSVKWSTARCGTESSDQMDGERSRNHCTFR